MKTHLTSHDEDFTQVKGQAHIWSEEAARAYVDLYGEHPINRLTAEGARLMSDDCVLDIGCGSGSALRAGAEIATRGELIGVDLSPVMVRIAQNESADHPDFARMRYHLGGAEALPLSGDRATVCWAINSMHHWQDIAQGLAEVRRVMVPQGRFIVVEEIFPDSHGLDAEEVTMHLASAGFEVESTRIQDTGDAQFNVLIARNAKEV